MSINEVKEKLKKFINRIINSEILVLIIGTFILLKTFLFYNNTIAINESLWKETIIGTISFIAVIICFLSVLPNRARIITTIFIDLLLSILLLGDNLYYTYSTNVLSVAQITNLQYGEEIISTLPLVVEAKQILYF